jgi:hypothetical protein
MEIYGMGIMRRLSWCRVVLCCVGVNKPTVIITSVYLFLMS